VLGTRTPLGYTALRHKQTNKSLLITF
jgi:hypothetical protein